MKRIKLLFFLFLIFLFITILIRDYLKFIDMGQYYTKYKEPFIRKHLYIPYKKRVEIKQDFLSSNIFTEFQTSLDFLDRKSFKSLRILKIKKYAFLNVFPRNYDPYKGYHRRIYRSIKFNEKWLGPTAFFVTNPYNLIILTKANHVTAVNLVCMGGKIIYEGNTVREKYYGKNAKSWFDFFKYDNEYSHIRVNMVNAYDAGFIYSYIDKCKSINIEEGDYKPNIMNSLFSQHSFFHVGRYGVNNISPKDTKGWIKIKKYYNLTRIFVKLWQEKPKSLEADGELNYIIEVLPK